MISEFKKNKQLFRRVRLGLLTLSGLLSVIALYFIGIISSVIQQLYFG